VPGGLLSARLSFLEGFMMTALTIYSFGVVTFDLFLLGLGVYGRPRGR